MVGDKKESKSGCEFDPSRRNLVVSFIRYAIGLTLLDVFLPEIACSKTSAEGKKTPGKLLKKASPSIDGKTIARAQKGDPYSLTRRAVEALGGMSVFVKKGERVMLMPNIGWDRSPEQAACTHPEVVRAVIEMCKDAGAGEVGVFCHSCHPAQSTYKTSGIADASDKAGARLWYVSPDPDFETVDVGGKRLQKVRVFKELLKSDRFINIPIAKVHSLSVLTMAMKNLLGAVEDRPSLHPDIHNNLPELARILKPDLNILDATRILVRNGPTGGSLADVEKPEMVIAGSNIVSVDAVGAGLFGKEPSTLRFLTIANSMGLGEYNLGKLKIVEA